jgi:hypothetical protein
LEDVVEKNVAGKNVAGNSNAESGKGQINVEYFVSVIVFIIFTSYIVIELLRFVPYYLVEVDNEVMRSEAYQLSELLVNDAGSPSNWENHDAGAITRLGLSDEKANRTNMLSMTKVQSFNSNCTTGGGYDKVGRWLDTYDSFSIVIIDSATSNVVANCQPAAEEARVAGLLNITVRRIVAFDSGSYGELILNLW